MNGDGKREFLTVFVGYAGAHTEVVDRVVELANQSQNHWRLVQIDTPKKSMSKR